MIATRPTTFDSPTKETRPSQATANQHDPTDRAAKERQLINKLLLFNHNLKIRFPSLKSILDYFDSFLLHIESFSNNKRAALILGFIILTWILKKKPILGTQILVMFRPVYQSLRAIERPRVDDDERWLTWWACFGTSVVLDWFIKNKIYQYSKILFFHWLSMDGSLIIYRTLLRKLVISN